MRDGGAIVEVDKGSPQVLYIDHQRRSARAGQTIGLPGGGRVRYGTTQTVVTWGDGTTARVFSIGDEGVNIAIKPSRSRAGLLTGLLGNDDRNPRNDFVGRDGHRYSADEIESVGLFVFNRAELQILLGGFGRSWRITQAESLFVYPPGKTTSSYLVPGFPRTLVSLLSLSRRRRRTAANVCRRAHVTNATLLAGCTIDYGATGDHRLATATGTLQRVAGIRGSRPAPTGGLSGTWSGRYSGAFQGTFILTWQQSGSNLSGTIKLSSPAESLRITGNVNGSSIRFGAVGAVTYSGSVSGNTMSGTYRSRIGGGSWSATKTS
jgi:hypothetical protein